MDFDEAVQKGFLQKIAADKKMIEKELKASEYDLSKSQSSLEEDDYKWAIIKVYYSILNASRALLFTIGYREKKHFAVGIALEELARNKKIEMKMVSDFHAALSAREDANYRETYSKETAEYIVEIAEEFLKAVRRALKTKR